MFQFRKSKPLNILSKTKNMLTGKESRNGGDKAREREGEAEGRRRALSASAGDVSAEQPDAAGLPAAASEPDLRDQVTYYFILFYFHFVLSCIHT